MQIRKEYGNESVDDLICYFMKTILRIRKYGIAEIPIDISINEAIDGFLHSAIHLMEDAQPPEIFDLVLQVEYDYMLKNKTLSKNDITLAVLITNMARHICFDEDNTDYLLSTSNIWENKAWKYLNKTFIVNLPKDIQIKEGFDYEEEPYKRIPLDFFEPNNY